MRVDALKESGRLDQGLTAAALASFALTSSVPYLMQYVDLSPLGEERIRTHMRVIAETVTLVEAAGGTTEADEEFRAYISKFASGELPLDKPRAILA